MLTYALSQAVQSSVHLSSELQVVQHLLVLLHSYLGHIERIREDDLGSLNDHVLVIWAPSVVYSATLSH